MRWAASTRCWWPARSTRRCCYYLNNADSTKDNPNENYGRELLELHSVSVDGGYDEEDMRQSTLIMTGFGVELGDRSVPVQRLALTTRAR